MANTFVTPVHVAGKILDSLDNNVKMGQLVRREYSKEFMGQGDTMFIRQPSLFEIQDGPAITSSQSINQGKIPLTLSQWKTILIDLSGQDMAMNYEAFSDWFKNFIEPSCIRLANEVDSFLLSAAKSVPGITGTPGTPPASFDSIAAAHEYLRNQSCPEQMLYGALTPKGWRTLGGGLTTLYNPQEPIGKLVQEGKLPNVDNVMLFPSQNCPVHTVGDYAGTPLVNGASQTGDSVITDGWTASKSLNKDDVFTLAGVYMVNPVTKNTTDILQPFRVTSNTSADGSGNMTIPISPKLITSGAYQTVSGSPADNAVVTIKTGTAKTAYGQSIIFHPSSIALGTAKIPPLGDGVKSQTFTHKGFSINISSGSDIMNYKKVWRADILYGACLLYDNLICRITN